MQLLILKNNSITQLIPYYGSNEAAQLFYMLSAQYLGFSKVDIALEPQYEISEKSLQLFKIAINKLLEWEPIQYILGQAYFYGNEFKVTPSTLIPRPETEELVDWVVADLKDQSVTILDIGTGSGCIAISLALNLPNAQVSAIDISEKALTVAKENANILGADIRFETQNILEQNQLFSSFDVVVSNPPYVRHQEKKAMQPNVLDYEPETALFVQDHDPLVFYKKIALLFLEQAQKGALLYFEINEYLTNEMIKLLKNLGFTSIQIKKDFRGKDRMLKAIV